MTSIGLSTMFLAFDREDEDPAPAARSAADKARRASLVADHFEVIWRTLARIRVPSADLADCVQQVFVVASRRVSSNDRESHGETRMLGLQLRARASRRGGMSMASARGGLGAAGRDSALSEREAELIPYPCGGAAGVVGSAAGLSTRGDGAERMALKSEGKSLSPSS